MGEIIHGVKPILPGEFQHRTPGTWVIEMDGWTQEFPTGFNTTECNIILGVLGAKKWILEQIEPNDIGDLTGYINEGLAIPVGVELENRMASLNVIRETQRFIWDLLEDSRLMLDIPLLPSYEKDSIKDSLNFILGEFKWLLRKTE